MLSAQISLQTNSLFLETTKKCDEQFINAFQHRVCTKPRTSKMSLLPFLDVPAHLCQQPSQCNYETKTWTGDEKFSLKKLSTEFVLQTTAVTASEGLLQTLTPREVQATKLPPGMTCCKGQTWLPAKEQLSYWNINACQMNILIN